MNYLRIGDLLGETFRIVLRSIVRLIILGILILGPGGLIFFGLVFVSMGSWDPDVLERAEPSGAMLGGMVLGYFAFLVGYVVYTAAVVVDVYARLRGNPLGLGTVLRSALRESPRLFGLMIVVGILYFLSTLPLMLIQAVLLSAPLVMVAMTFGWMAAGMAIVCIWFVIFPVCVIEECGLSSFRRSAELTRHQRMRILATLLVFSLVASGVYMVTIFFGMAFAAIGSGLEGAGGRTAALIGGIIGFFVFFLVLLVLASMQTVLPTVTYHHLRVLREGETPDSLVEVFS